MLPTSLKSVLIFLLLFGFFRTGFSQIRVVNMVPLLQSNQTSNDDEPNIAVNPANKLQIVGTAFTPDPMGGPNAPIYISTDGGVSWALNSIIPGNDPTYGTSDITLRFAGSSGRLYVGDLKGGAPTFTMNILRVPDFTSSTPADLMLTRSSVDQPYVQATTVLGGSGVTKDRVYVTANDRGSSPLSLGINLSLDAFSDPAPDGFATNLFPNRPGTSRVEPGTRPTIHNSGVCYIAFYNNTSSGTDVVVARDDNWGNGSTPFQNLLDLTDGLPGQRVVTGRNLPAFGVNLGGSRLVASNISIAVDPTNASLVYVAWADRVGTTDYTLHVRSSSDLGQHWSSDLLTITNATNPALAVNIRGKLGFLYQKLTGSGSTQRWETHLQRSINAGSSWDDAILNTALVSDPGAWLGDYDHLMAVGKDFYGIFSASNYPDMANFPQSVTYQRNANFTTHQLLGTDNVTVIGVSKDPFFFQVTEQDDDNDFFVRDFTNSTTDFDPGLEPSTDPWFFVNSDVWNKRSNAPGAFNANDQPQSEDPWQSTDGHNYAFARVHRKATGAAQNVSLHFLYSEFGTGSNFVDANTTADPTLSFGTSDVDLTMSSGYEWDLPVTTSNHTCLAVEITGPNDPIIQPSLLNHTPGWGTGTDLMVLNDNNKAQRNMQVYRMSMGGGAPLISYAAIHNPGLYERNMTINWRTDSRVAGDRKASVVVIGNRDQNRAVTDGITLLGMKPGETRFIRIVHPVGGGEGVVVPLAFAETRDSGVVLNGFVVASETSSADKVLEQNVLYSRQVLRRYAGLYNNKDVEATDAEFLQRKQFTGEAFLAYYKRRLPTLRAINKQVLQTIPGDPFGLEAMLTQSESMTNANDLATAHLSYLNGLDACMTTVELAKGNTADFLQTVYIQKDVAVVLKRVSSSAGLLAAATRFAQLVESRKASLKDYPGYVKDILPLLKKCTAEIKGNQAMVAAVSQIEQSLSDPVALEKAYMDWLILVRGMGS